MPATHVALQVEQHILLLRGQKVMLDFHLAELYAVETRALQQAVRRNPDRFPADFMFERNAEEAKNLRSQNVISSSYDGSRHGYLAFTEQGVAMLSSVLRGGRAVQVDIAIMQDFVRLREMLGTNADLARKLKAPPQNLPGNGIPCHPAPEIPESLQSQTPPNLAKAVLDLLSAFMLQLSSHLFPAISAPFLPAFGLKARPSGTNLPAIPSEKD